MEVFDLIFWLVGKSIHKGLNRLGIASREMSDGGYWTLGFVSTCLIGLAAFMIWGAVYLH